MEVSDERKGSGSWWEIEIWEEEIMERFEERSNAEGDDEEEDPYLHFLEIKIH